MVRNTQLISRICAITNVAAVLVILFVIGSVIPSILLIREYPGDAFSVSRMQDINTERELEIAFLSYACYTIFSVFIVYGVYVVFLLSILLPPEHNRYKIVCLLMIPALYVLIHIAERRMTMLGFVTNIW